MIEFLIVLGTDAAENLLKSVATKMGWAHHEYYSEERRVKRRLRIQLFAQITKAVLLSVLAMPGAVIVFKKAATLGHQPFLSDQPIFASAHTVREGP